MTVLVDAWHDNEGDQKSTLGRPEWCAAVGRNEVFEEGLSLSPYTQEHVLISQSHDPQSSRQN